MKGIENLLYYGIVHRDLKLENILLKDESSIVIADFGLAIKLPDGEKEIESDRITGTEKYMAPEIAMYKE